MNDEHYISLALKQAKLAALTGEVPVGALVVSKEGEVLASAHNQTEQDSSVTHHAEMLALKGAGKKLGNWRLADCTLFVTLEPCIMCAYATKLSRVGRVVYGAPDKRMGGFGTIYDLSTAEHLGSQIEVISGILEADCSKLLVDFFKEKRS